MIDMPLVLQARNILQTVQAIDDHHEASEKAADVDQDEGSPESVEPKNKDTTSVDVKSADEEKK